jgi:hypothetical protein
MLKKLVIEYEDGSIENRIVPSNQATIYPKQNGIKKCDCSPFKYKVEKHAYLCAAIVKYGDVYKIMPAGVYCIPETTLEDIEVIDNNKPKEPAAPREKHTWKFKSSSSDSTYVVKENWGKLRCDCMGSWRSKDRKCKHIKEVEQELNKQK